MHISHLTFLVESYVANDGDYSTLRPFVFSEVLLRVFTKKPQYVSVYLSLNPFLNCVPDSMGSSSSVTAVSLT